MSKCKYIIVVLHHYRQVLCGIGEIHLHTTRRHLILSQRFCEDALEQLFGCQRQRGGGVHDNPNVKEFISNTQALQVINSFTTNFRGNCRGSNVDRCTTLGIENEPLPKGKTHRSKQ